jgi:hypothetical protein
MRNLAVAAVGVGFGVACLTIWACSDSPQGSNFTDPTGADSGDIEAGNGFNVEAGSPDGNVVGACNPSLPATFSPTWKPPTKAAVCTSDDLNAYFDACTDPKASACTSWLAAHKSCGDCIEATDNTGPIQVFENRLFVLLNVAGCLDLIQPSDTCAKAYDAVFQCRRESCTSCFSANQTSADQAFQAFNQCESKAACSTYTGQQTTACAGDKDPDGGAPQCFPTSTEQSALNGADTAAATAARKTFFTRVMAVTCGK